MSNTPNYVAYVDVVGVGDASIEDSDSYHDHLRRFRTALCDAVDRHLTVADKVFAFSDCAFASSQSLSRVGTYLERLQYLLWEQNIFLKGAISVGKPGHVEFAALAGQTKELVAERRRKLQGYWFAKDFVQPALLEKNLKGIAIQIDSSIEDKTWLQKHATASSFFASEHSKRPIVIRDLMIPPQHLNSLDSLLRTYMLVNHSSRRLSRYYVPLIVTWIKSHDYSRIEHDAKTGEWHNAPPPLRQLILNPKIAAEVAALVGGNVIFYSLLAKVATECDAEKVKEHVFDFLAGNKKLRAAAELIPEEICSNTIRRKVAESRVQYLFSSRK
ncbi:MAG TPA: hypothetical protein VGO68_07400 [Pyrinomonadaceae bacterium]|jgi:hypothetical protein|nr:hypothetical protein [Pyrinomonadaceae bacterium]